MLSGCGMYPALSCCFSCCWEIRFGLSVLGFGLGFFVLGSGGLGLGVSGARFRVQGRLML